jgi:hypothetical protein
VPSDETDLLIEMINGNDDLPWTANTCMLQKHHKDHNCDHVESLAQKASNTTEKTFIKSKASG